MSVDIKTILLVILIIGVIGAVTFFAINILNEPSSVDNSSPIQNNTTSVTNTLHEENTMSENIISENIVEYTNETDESITEETSDSSEDMSDFRGTGLNVNNDNPTSGGEDYSNIKLMLTGGSKVSFWVPYDWENSTERCLDPVTGSVLTASNSMTKSFIDQVYNGTTYEDVLEAFTEREKNEFESTSTVEVSRRTLEIGDKSIPIIVLNDNNKVVSYIVFIKGVYEYHLRYECGERYYNSETTTIIDNVFKSFKVI